MPTHRQRAAVSQPGSFSCPYHVAKEKSALKRESSRICFSTWKAAKCISEDLRLALDIT